MSDDAKIIVLKITAAQRQLDAAVRMYFSNEDPLAAYTVAAASNRILRDLISEKGESAATHILHQAFNHSLEQAVEMIDNRLRDEGLVFPAPVIRQAATMASNLGLRDILDIPDLDKNFWRFLNKGANFLKHADRDARASISEDQIEIESVLDSALAMYVHLMAEVTPEMHTYWLYRSIGERVYPQPAWVELQRSRLARVPGQRRRRACVQLIEKMKTRAKTRPIPRLRR